MQGDLQLTTQLEAFAQRRRDDVARQHTVGLATELDLMRADVELMQRSMEVMLAQHRLHALQRTARDSVRP